ncbi:MAG: class I SAM-dependent methyltransferase [Chloroflexi bacterium]|nr:class I SAM-dependent methyltransferase [Chloroflexota bacterium]
MSGDLSDAPRPLLDTPRYHYVRADCRRLPFQSESFDLVHVTFPSRADQFVFQSRPTATTFGLNSMPASIAGVARVLRPRGCFVVFPYWTGDEAWETALRQTLRQHGFSLTVEGPYSGLFVALFHRVPGLAPTMTASRTVSLRLDDNVYQGLLRKASRQGLSVGEWLTRLVAREAHKPRWPRFWR